MRRLDGTARVARLIDDAIERFALDLSGVTVLTETASGPFVVTPLIAARAGGSVIAVTRDSRFGSAEEVQAHTLEWAAHLDVGDCIQVHAGSAADRAGEAELVTNLGFVRPIDEAFARRAASGSVVSLMCEPWEVRPHDVDVGACRAAGLAVLGTDERDPRLQTFRFVGVLALKLLLALEVELLFSRVVVTSSEPFATPIVEVLRAVGADVRLVDVTLGDDPRDPSVIEACRHADAVVVAEHRDRRAVVGGETGIPVEVLTTAGAAVAHIAGNVEDPDGILHKHPGGAVAPGWMTVTTDVLGPRPVVDLHAAGLRVGRALVEGARMFGTVREAEAYALEHSPARRASESS